MPWYGANIATGYGPTGDDWRQSRAVTRGVEAHITVGARLTVLWLRQGASSDPVMHELAAGRAELAAVCQLLKTRDALRYVNGEASCKRRWVTGTPTMAATRPGPAPA